MKDYIEGIKLLEEDELFLFGKYLILDDAASGKSLIISKLERESISTYDNVTSKLIEDLKADNALDDENIVMTANVLPPESIDLLIESGFKVKKVDELFTIEDKVALADLYYANKETK